ASRTSNLPAVKNLQWHWSLIRPLNSVPLRPATRSGGTCSKTSKQKIPSNQERRTNNQHAGPLRNPVGARAGIDGGGVPGPRSDVGSNCCYQDCHTLASRRKMC